MTRRTNTCTTETCQGRKSFRPWFLIALPIAFIMLAVSGALNAGGFLASQSLLGGQVVYAQEPPVSNLDFDLADVPPPTVPPSARSGALLYQENCAPCHGATGMGDGPTVADLPTPPLAFADPDLMWDKTPAALFHVTKFGRIESLMPPWGNRMSDGQIWQAVAFSWSLHTTESALSDAADLYAASCAECHGLEGAGDGVQAGAVMPDFTDPAYAMVHSQAAWLDNWMALHPQEGAVWTATEQRAVLEYVRSFSYIPPWESGYRPGAGLIQGQVVQGTPGGPDVDGLMVQLEAYANFEPVATFTTTVETDGRFEFVDLALDETIVYLAFASSANIRYGSALLTLTPDEPLVTTQIAVYETTEDASGIQLDRAHWIIDFQPGVALIGQIFNYGSSSDRTYTGQLVDGVDVPVTIALALPPGAQEIAFENGALGARFQQVGNLIYDTTPVIPGSATKQIILRFVLPYAGDSLSIGQEFPYPIGQIDLLLAELPGLESAVTNLASAGSQSFQGRAYQIWQGDGLQPGVIGVELSGLLRSSDVDPRSLEEIEPSSQPLRASATVAVLEPWMAWATGTLIVVMVTSLFGWAWTQGRIKTVEDAQALALQRAELLRQIAHLDDLNAMGDVDVQSWQLRRAPLKAKLLEIAVRMADSDSLSA